MVTHTLVLVRHGTSVLNDENRFASWYDTPLSDKGRQMACRAGAILKDAGFQFHVAFSSVLSRTVESLRIILNVLGQPDVPHVRSWRLNERHYGDLIGRNRAETAAKYGLEQTQIWRRGYDVPPPPITPANPHYYDVVCNPIFADGPSPEEFPVTESLKMTIDRLLPFWYDGIVPHIQDCKRVLICAHGSGLRGLAMHLEGIPERDIAKLTIPNSIPVVYELNEQMKAVGPMRYLEDEHVVRAATEAIDAQLTQSR